MGDKIVGLYVRQSPGPGRGAFSGIFMDNPVLKGDEKTDPALCPREYILREQVSGGYNFF
jgi:hypothetical protein